MGGIPRVRRNVLSFSCCCCSTSFIPEKKVRGYFLTLQSRYSILSGSFHPHIWTNIKSREGAKACWQWVPAIAGVEEDDGDDNKLLQGHESEKFGHDLNFKRRYNTSRKKKKKSRVNRAPSSTLSPCQGVIVSSLYRSTSFGEESEIRDRRIVTRRNFTQHVSPVSLSLLTDEIWRFGTIHVRIVVLRGHPEWVIIIKCCSCCGNEFYYIEREMTFILEENLWFPQ